MGAIASAPAPVLAAPRRLLRLRSDAVLAGRYAAGDEGAFAVLYERYRGSVLAACMGVLGSRHDAEDAAQEVFAALAQALGRTPPQNVAAWLTRVARNAAIDVARRRRSSAEPRAELPDRPAGGDGIKAELESVMAGLKELPESQRTALLLRELGGHSYREIAQALELDEASVRGLIARGRIGLRTYRDATEMLCAGARAALAVSPDDLAVLDRAVRRHVRLCASCRAYRRGLQGDARALRALLFGPVAPLAGGGALLGKLATKGGGLATKGALLGGAVNSVNQVVAACAVSVCAVGGVALLTPGARHHHVSPIHHRSGAVARRAAPSPSSRSTPAIRAQNHPSPQQAAVTHAAVARQAVTAIPRVAPAAPERHLRPPASRGSGGGGQQTPARPTAPSGQPTVSTPSPPASAPTPSAPAPTATTPSTAYAWWLRLAQAFMQARTASGGPTVGLPYFHWPSGASTTGTSYPAP
jgi:RNA polymerase sigma factor (sigma-70 family)